MFLPYPFKRFLAAPEEFSATHHPLFFTPETMEVWSSTALCFSCNLGDVGNPCETQGLCLNILEDFEKNVFVSLNGASNAMNGCVCVCFWNILEDKTCSFVRNLVR